MHGKASLKVFLPAIGTKAIKKNGIIAIKKENKFKKKKKKNIKKKGK